MKMFTMLALLLVFTSFQGALTERDTIRFIIDAVIRQLFEMFKEVIKNGDDKNGIPILDPFKFEHQTLNFTEDALRGKINVSNGSLLGLGDHQLKSFTFTKTDISLEMEVYFPALSITAENYDMNGAILEIIPFSGRGSFDMNMREVTIKGKVFLKQSDDGKSILLADFEDMQFSIANIKVRLGDFITETVYKSATEFDNNIDEIINAMIDDLAADYLTKFSKTICTQYGSNVVRAFNTVLDKLENWFIIAAIL